MVKTNQTIYPFTGILGQDEMKIALILNVIEPKIGGVLLIGERGTGKTTTIRSFSHLFSLDPSKEESNMIEIPLGVTEDRLCGSINFENLMLKGKYTFEPGLLAKANNKLLYIDEINLLDDYIVDLLLDSSTSGWNIIERDGISHKYPANFSLIGSANPEEGLLRPQLLDRFGMYVHIETIRDLNLRFKIIQDRILFDHFPKFIIEKYKKDQMILQAKIKNAKQLLPIIEINDIYQFKISEFCAVLGVQGFRGDLTCIRAAKALAAFENRSIVSLNDIKRILPLCLYHRLSIQASNLNNNKEFLKKKFKEIFCIIRKSFLN